MFNNKGKRIISTIIIVVLILAMIVPLCLSIVSL